ncbi:uncharacterized protein LOC131944988 [Physella acuta]|uniref:uncharacterized protein LOC131944988 n=1 Tax=Physella acuta TaxID=109671 RepID=UPI0027DCD592|nr:uncharacterized protein LOC131944988 [Physella acuta]
MYYLVNSKMSDVYKLLWSVCVLMNGFLQTSADFKAERKKVSHACSSSLDACVAPTGSHKPSSDASWCSLLEATKDGVSAYQCVIRIGLCTDEEFVALKNGACGQTATAQHTSSELKKSLYDVVKSLNDDCSGKLVMCIFGSSLATVFKQQEQYCKLINLDGAACFNMACTKSEISNLNTTACKTTQSQPFSDAIVATSQKCHRGLDKCLSTVSHATVMIRGEKYCDVMGLSEKYTTHDCMLELGCTELEFTAVKSAACGGSPAQPAHVSATCTTTKHTCARMASSLVPSNDAGWCRLFGSSINGTNSYQCMVNIGLCTEEEFVSMTNQACGQSIAVQHPSSALKTSLYTAIYSTSDDCRGRLLSCILDSGVATIFKVNEQYCKLVNMDKAKCLKAACTKEEITSLNTTACATTQSQPFSDVIAAASHKCQSGVDSCVTSRSHPLTLIRTQKYCEFMNLFEKYSTHDCWIEFGCTESEFVRAKTAACSGSHVLPSLIVLALAALHLLL